jgi:hypothetical protein
MTRRPKGVSRSDWWHTPREERKARVATTKEIEAYLGWHEARMQNRVKEWETLLFGALLEAP